MIVGRAVSASPRPDRRVDRVEIRVPVGHAEHLPPVGRIPLQHVLAEGPRRRAVERHVVVVVEVEELAETEVAGERPGLGGDALHEVAVRDESERAVVHDLVARPIESRRERALGDRHAHGVGRSLPERSGRRLDTRRQAKLGMPRRPASPLPETLQVLERQVVAGQMEQDVEERASVARREHEAIPVGPVRIARIVLQVALPEDERHRRGAERQSRMARVGLLDDVDRQRSDRIDAELIEGFLDRAQVGSSSARQIGGGRPKCGLPASYTPARAPPFGRVRVL